MSNLPCINKESIYLTVSAEFPPKVSSQLHVIDIQNLPFSLNIIPCKIYSQIYRGVFEI